MAADCAACSLSGEPATRREEQKIASKSSDTPKSGGGSSQDSSSPLASRRGNADPTDVDDTPLNLEFSELDYDANSRKPSATDPWAPSH